MRILLEYKNFLNSKYNKKIFESDEKSFVGIIGDSGVGLYTSQIKELKTFGTGTQVLNKGGWSSTKLKEALQNHAQTYPEIGILFVKIGDNDLYKINLARQNAPEIKSQIQRVFPNVTRMVMVKGGWGWEGLSKFTTETEPNELVEYYEEFRKNGFEVIQLSQGKLASDREAHTVHSGIKAQCVEIRKVIDGYKPSQEILASTDQQNVTSEGTVGGYYQSLTTCIETGIELRRQNRGQMVFNELVQIAQMGLKFLGFDLPRFGADGLFGPETENSVRNFKQSNNVEGDPNVMDTNFFVALKNKLIEQNFDENSVKEINLSVSKNFAEMLNSVGNNNLWIYWLGHNQGAYGASELLRVSLDPDPSVRFANNARGYFMSGWSTPYNHIRRNVGDNGEDGVFKSQIKAAYDAGDDKGVAIAFCAYQKWKFDQMYQNGNQQINNHPNIKEIFLKAIKDKNSDVPFEFLAAVSYQESKFNPRAGNQSYKGLFALSPKSTGLSAEELYDPYKNTMAALDFWDRLVPTLINLLSPEVKNQLKVQPLA